MARCEYNSPIGRIVIETESGALTGLSFSEEKITSGYDDASRLAAKWLDIYFSGGIPDFMPPVSFHGTPFRNTVWELLAAVPYGETVSYGRLGEMTAEKLSKERMSPRAIGGAVGHNPIAIIIPCHRVISSDGSLGGYHYGRERKRFLLELEKGQPRDLIK